MEDFEEWRDVKGYEGMYQISNLGRFRSCSRMVKNKHSYRPVKEKVLKPFKWGSYMYVHLRSGEKLISRSVHRLVAEAFILNTHNKPEVNHIDGNKMNNCASNLEWCTSSENELHAARTGLINYARKRVRCVNTETGSVHAFDSCAAAARWLGLHRNTLYDKLKRSEVSSPARYKTYIIEEAS